MTTARKSTTSTTTRKRTPARLPHDPPAKLDEHAAEVWREIVAAHAEAPNDPARVIGHDLETYCSLVATLRDVRARIAEGSEEVIIADERDRPVPHPAFDLMAKLSREIREWGDKFKPRPARAPAPERGRSR